MEGTQTKAERLTKCFRRLGETVAAASFEEAYRLCPKLANDNL